VAGLYHMRAGNVLCAIEKNMYFVEMCVLICLLIKSLRD